MNNLIQSKIFILATGLCILLGAGFVRLIVLANHDAEKNPIEAEVAKTSAVAARIKSHAAEPPQHETHQVISDNGGRAAALEKDSSTTAPQSGGMVEIQRIKPIFYQVDPVKLESADPSVRADYAALMQQYNDYVAQWNTSGSADLNAWNTKMSELQSQYNQKIGEALGSQVTPIVENVSVPASSIAPVSTGEGSGGAVPAVSGGVSGSYNAGTGNATGSGNSLPAKGSGRNGTDPGPGLIHFGGSGGLPNNEGLPPQTYHLGGS